MSNTKIPAIPVQLDAAAFQRLTDGLTLLWPDSSEQLFNEPIDQLTVSNASA
jgi:hypothetical protein